MLNSLHLATEGLLRRGSKPTLGIAVLGYLRTFEITYADPPKRSDGGGRRVYFDDRLLLDMNNLAIILCAE